MPRMNAIGIENNLDRSRIRKLLATGLLGCVLTGAGDFLLGYATPVDVGGGAFDAMLSTAPNLSDGALFAGGLLGMFGLFIEGLSFFGVWRLMADAAPRLAHTYRSGIFFYLWLAPVGCHMNVGLLNYAYKQLWLVSPEVAHAAVTPMYCAFCIPLYALLVVGWVPMLVAQWKAFAQGKPRIPRGPSGSRSPRVPFRRWSWLCSSVQTRRSAAESARCSSRWETPSPLAGFWLLFPARSASRSSGQDSPLAHSQRS